MRILTFTTLYPNAEQKNHGLFVEHRLVNLLNSHQDIKAKVMAPVPWFPLKSDVFGRYGKFASINSSESRRGIEIFHPRYPVLPKVGMSIAPLLLAGFCARAIRRIFRSGWDFDLIDAHYFYPDGVAAVMLGQYLRKPVVVTARGSDINVLPNYAIPRKQLLWAANHCDGVITVCDALGESLTELGATPRIMETLRNGVDLDLFYPHDRQAARQKLGLKPEDLVLVSVGHLDENKGHHLIIDALSRLDRDALLLVVGEGTLLDSLKDRARSSGVIDRVRFCGSVAQSELAQIYSAADMLVLASGREGMANVILEAMACGTPVVATNVSGAPEVVKDGISGQLIRDRTSLEIAVSVKKLLAVPLERQAIRAYAEQFSWESTSDGQAKYFKQVISDFREQ